MALTKQPRLSLSSTNLEKWHRRKTQPENGENVQLTFLTSHARCTNTKTRWKYMGIISYIGVFCFFCQFCCFTTKSIDSWWIISNDCIVMSVTCRIRHFIKPFGSLHESIDSIFFYWILVLISLFFPGIFAHSTILTRVPTRINRRANAKIRGKNTELQRAIYILDVRTVYVFHKSFRNHWKCCCNSNKYSQSTTQWRSHIIYHIGQRLQLLSGLIL